MLGEEENEGLDAGSEKSSPPAGGARGWWCLDPGGSNLFNVNSPDISFPVKFYRYLVETCLVRVCMRFDIQHRYARFCMFCCFILPLFLNIRCFGKSIWLTNTSYN
jgi:hypothetical protein